MEILEVSGERCEVVKLLGKGKGGYSYLVRRGGEQLVLKQIHHEPCEYYTFGDKVESELRDYQTLERLGVPMPRLIAVDRENERILKQYIDGPTALQLVTADSLPEFCIPQIQQLCKTLYAARINIDYFPTNFVLQGEQLYYVDYECSGYMQQWDFEHWGINYWSLTPELQRWIDEQG